MQTFKKIVIYFLLWSFGILTFPVILFLNWKNKDKNYKNYLIASGIGFGMFLIVLPFTDEPDTASTQEVAQEEEQTEEDDEEEDTEEENEAEDTEEEEENDEPQEEQGLDEKIEAVANDVLEDRIMETKYEEDEGAIDVEFQLLENLNNEDTRTSFLIDTEIFSEQIQNEDFNRISFSGFTDLVDKYGNVENTKVATLDMNKETIDKINFENFSYKNLPDIADEVNFHPALLDS